jgi:hypothetical protein
MPTKFSVVTGPPRSISGVFWQTRSTPIWWRRARFSSPRAARGRHIEDRVERSVVREMSIDENYERNITPIRSEISRFSRGAIVFVLSTYEND